VCKWTAQLSSALADWLMAALQCGGGPHHGCTLRYECLQSFIIFRCPWLREQLHSQCPKIIAPIVKMAAPIQIRTAALFSELVGVGFMTK
jgi:hypothetical protein